MSLNTSILTQGTNEWSNQFSSSIKKEPVDLYEYFNQGIIRNATDSDCLPSEGIPTRIMPKKEKEHEEENPNNCYSGHEILSQENIDSTQVPRTNGSGLNCQVLRGEAIESSNHASTGSNLGDFNRSHFQLPAMKEEISGGPIPVMMDLTPTDDRNFEKQFYRKEIKSDNGIFYKCTVCTFHTMYEQYIINHNRLHLNSYKISEDKLFKCSFSGCNFQTAYKKSIQGHSRIHSDIVHTCDKCSFQTKSKEYLRVHNLRVHADSPDTKIFSCDKCAYENNFKVNFIKHQRIHINPEELPLLKCPVTTCSYETRHREGLNRHKQRHKNSWELKLKKCALCGYHSRDKSHLRVHIRNVHSDLSDEPLYKCDKCSFQTHIKKTIAQHGLVHQDASQLDMFECHHCPFKAKRRCNLQQHLVKHTDPTELVMYKCAICSFETKRKHCLKNHIATHQKKA
ncbi:hypothetical protein JTB14_021615 [Gonioctena quinquepunctata]|nr:hypothetical protein JTB14_021615 [Gonioctena quinquepunctata]